MKTLKIKALGLEGLCKKESSINGGNVLGTLGPSDFYPTDAYGDALDKIGKAIGDAYDWVKGFVHGLFS